jgi:hypothetical protein
MPTNYRVITEIYSNSESQILLITWTPGGNPNPRILDQELLQVMPKGLTMLRIEVAQNARERSIW